MLSALGKNNVIKHRPKHTMMKNKRALKDFFGVLRGRISALFSM